MGLAWGLDAQPDAQARTDDPYVQPLLSHEGIASALADFDARTAVWVDKCNANGITEVLCREDLPVSYYALRGDFLFFLLGFKPACLIGHGSTEVRKLYIDTLLEDVWRPALHALEDAGDVQFELIGWDCNPFDHISSDSKYSFKDALVVLNTRHKFADHARETFTQPSRSAGGTLMLRFAKDLDYPTCYSDDVEVEYRMDSPDYLMLAEYMTSFHGSHPTRFLKHFVQYRDAARPFGCDLKFVMGGIVIPNEIVELLIRMEPGVGKAQRYMIDVVVAIVGEFNQLSDSDPSLSPSSRKKLTQRWRDLQRKLEDMDEYNQTISGVQHGKKILPFAYSVGGETMEWFRPI